MYSFGQPWLFTTCRSWGKYVGTWYFHHMIQCSQAFWIPPWRIRIFLKFQILSTCCFNLFLHFVGYLIYWSFIQWFSSLDAVPQVAVETVGDDGSHPMDISLECIYEWVWKWEELTWRVFRWQSSRGFKAKNNWTCNLLSIFILWDNWRLLQSTVECGC